MASKAPPSIVTVPLPKMPPAEIARTPATIVVLENELPLLPKAKVPLPALVREYPAPEMTPPTVSVLAETVTCRLAASVTGPVPRLRGLLPLKVKSPCHFCG